MAWDPAYVGSLQTSPVCLGINILIPALQEAFGQPAEPWPGCGVPVARLQGLFRAGAGLLLKRVVAPLLTHELAQVHALHPS